ncbi:transposon TX1 [Tanacetum coccineum]
MSVRQREKSTTEQNGWRSGYNGKPNRDSINKDKQSTRASFMFFNFPEAWGMGDLWRMFKKYGTVYDMFMVNKRLRNGKRYDFVRFKNVVDNEMLYKALETIWIDKYKRRVFKAEDRKDKDEKVDGSKGENGRYGGDYNIKKGFNQYERDSEQDGCKQQEEVMINKSERLIEVEPDEHVYNIMERSIIGKVKKMEYLEKIHSFIKMEGMENVLVMYVVAVEQVRDSVEVEMEEEFCSDSEDGDMDDLMEDGECARSQSEERGTQLRQGFEILVKDRKFATINSVIKNKEWVSNDEVKLAEESQNEVLGHPLW